MTRWFLRLTSTAIRSEKGVAHLMSVSSIVLSAGGTEVQAIAGLSHDAAEDQGGEATLAVIRNRFGDDVARIVSDCTDAWVEPKPEWRPRKEAYRESLAGLIPNDWQTVWLNYNVALADLTRVTRLLADAEKYPENRSMYDAATANIEPFQASFARATNALKNWLFLPNKRIELMISAL
jgi:(p)ppGpp synthase/HD superfamily hydrolase